jgi:hypothetical protein
MADVPLLSVPQSAGPTDSGMIQASYTMAVVAAPAAPMANAEARLPGSTNKGENAPLKEREAAPSIATTVSPAAPRGEGWARGDLALYHIAGAQLICTLVAVIVVPFVVVLSVWVFLRRYSARHGPLFRIDFANVPVAAPAAAPSRTQAAESPSTAEAFDLGPTYEDELRMKEEALRQQEEAIVRHLVDQNVKLREQLGELHAASA